MVTTTSNGHADVREDDQRVVARIPRAIQPDDVLPRLVGLGIPRDEAQELADRHDEQRIIDALDALEEIGDGGRVLNPVGWVRAAVEQRWDLTDLLADRRDNERRLAALDADRREREEAHAAYPAWRAISDRWDRSISAALDDVQLERAIAAVTRPVPGIGRHSIPLARAELISWAVDVNGREPTIPLAEALADDLDRGPGRPEPPRWPVPEPPNPPEETEARPLSSRLTDVLGHDLDTARDTSQVIEVAVPHRTVRFGQDLER